MDVPGFMGMALSMSEINKKLNALSRQQNESQPVSAPLRAATVRPLPTSRAPLFAAAACLVALVAGGAGWWLGAQSKAASAADVVLQHNRELPQPLAARQAERHQPEPEAVTPHPEVTSARQAVTQAAEAKPPSPTVVTEPEAVKPGPAPKVGMQAQAIKTVAKAKETPEPGRKVHTGAVADTAVSPPRAETRPVVPPAHSANEPAEGLRIETVELDASQLASVEYQKAKNALTSGDSRKAIGHLESALKYQPEWIKARQKLSALYYGRGETRKAIAALQQGLALDREQPDLRLTLAKLLVNESQPQAALNVLSRLPEHSHSEYLAMRGALAQQLKNNELAMSSYQRLVKEEPYDGRWWMGLGIALERSEAAGKARDAYQQALLMGRISQQSQQFIQQRLAVLEAREG